MGVLERPYDAVHWWMEELQAQVVAKSGIPSDRHHLGKLILQGLNIEQDKIMQIDGATGETETFSSVLKRSVQCANAFRKLGLKYNDVVILMAPTHIDLCIPMYAGFYLGVGVAGIDVTLGVKELRDTFIINTPKVIFCQSDKVNDIQKALEGLDLSCDIVTFDSASGHRTFADLLKYGDGTTVEQFRASDFNPAETTALLISTSGTTGVPKSAEVTHKNLVFGIALMWKNFDTFPSPTSLSFVMSPIQWYSASFQIVSSPLLRQTRLQTSQNMTQEHAYYLINKYKPSFAMSSPNMWMTLFKPGDRDKCDFSSFELIVIGGSAMPPTLLDEMKKTTPRTLIFNIYGMSELSGLGFHCDATAPDAVGRPIPCLKYKLVNPDTQEEITEPDTTGELWIQGPVVFKGYFNNTEVTSQTKMDGWLRTGDLMYRTKNNVFYFVDRLKLLLKYRNNQVSPVEIESVIGKHPAVFEVAVTGIKHPEHGDLPVAFVVPHKGSVVTAQEIKDLVKSSLSDSKQLRGGVVFVEKLPLTISSKINRAKLAALAKEIQSQ